MTALRLGDTERVEQAVSKCGEALDADGILEKQQLAYILAQQVSMSLLILLCLNHCDALS